MIGEKLKKIRISRQIKQREIAKAINTVPQNIYSLEIGKTGKTFGLKNRYARALGIDLNELDATGSIIMLTEHEPEKVRDKRINLGIRIEEISKSIEVDPAVIELFEKSSIYWFEGIENYLSLINSSNKVSTSPTSNPLSAITSSVSEPDFSTENYKRSIELGIISYKKYTGNDFLNLFEEVDRTLFIGFATHAYSQLLSNDGDENPDTNEEENKTGKM